MTIDTHLLKKAIERKRHEVKLMEYVAPMQDVDRDSRAAYRILARLKRELKQLERGK